MAKVLNRSCIRAAKLYMLGVLLQGGGWIGQDSYNWGFNLSTLRVCGILNRIAFASLVVGIAYIWLPRRPHAASPDSTSVASKLPFHSARWRECAAR